MKKLISDLSDENERLKGLLELDFNFNGIKAHSSNPAKGKSANMNAAKFLVELEKFYNENNRIRKIYSRRKMI